MDGEILGKLSHHKTHAEDLGATTRLLSSSAEHSSHRDGASPSYPLNTF